MPARIRLQRKGKRGRPFYHIVIADGRAPRDGRFIERIGTYNPLTKPAEIIINFEKALDWLQKGAQPSDTVKAIFSYKGILYKNHLLKGVIKGALTEEQANAKFDIWLKDKEAKIEAKVKEGQLSLKELAKKRQEAEKKVNETRAEEIARKRAKEAEKAAAEARAKAEEEGEQAAAPVEQAPQPEAPQQETPGDAPAPAAE